MGFHDLNCFGLHFQGLLSRETKARFLYLRFLWCRPLSLRFMLLPRRQWLDLSSRLERILPNSQGRIVRKSRQWWHNPLVVPNIITYRRWQSFDFSEMHGYCSLCWWWGGHSWDYWGHWVHGVRHEITGGRGTEAVGKGNWVEWGEC